VAASTSRRRSGRASGIAIPARRSRLGSTLDPDTSAHRQTVTDLSSLSSPARLLRLLHLFTVERPYWTAEEAALELETSVSTAYRYIALLVQAGLLDPLEGSKRYVLGPAIIELDRTIRQSEPLVNAALPTMRWLVEQTTVPCVALLCRLYLDRVMCVHQERKVGTDSDVTYERGRPMPLLRGAPSKVILANLPARQLNGLVERLQKRAAKTAHFDWQGFKDELRLIRKAGFGVTRGEVDAGVTGICVPIFSPGGTVIASLGVACFGEVEAVAIARTRALLAASASEIELRLPDSRAAA
jgi:DNA-binding IclR family transcriptional regulator